MTIERITDLPRRRRRSAGDGRGVRRRRRPSFPGLLLGATLAVAGGDGPPASADDAPVAAAARQYPLAQSRIVLSDGKPATRGIVFEARWKGRVEFDDPASAVASMRVSGTRPGDGDTGVISLAPAQMWRGLGRPRGSRGYRYADRTRSSGGIAKVVLRQGRKGGVLRVRGTGPGWRYAITGAQGGVRLTLTIGRVRWCAEFTRFRRNARGRVKARTREAPASCPCDSFASTYDAIQALIFEKRGCTEAACHGAATAAGLDLRRGASYDHLVDVPASSAPLLRVEPGQKDRSVLYQRLSAGTLGIRGVGAPMPAGGLPPLAESQLEALRLWIWSGAPATGVVDGTQSLLDSCLPTPDPIKIRRPTPPAPGTGVQFHAPPWDLVPASENEVCYAVYYDFSSQIPDSMKTECPEEWGGPSRTCFFYNQKRLTQDPNSHHSIVHYYKGAFDIDSSYYLCNGGSRDRETCDAGDPGSCPGGACVGTPAFGPFTCKGGSNAGLACSPKGIGVPAPAGADCGPDGGCSGRVVDAVACILYGPPDWGFDLSAGGTANAPKIAAAQQPVSYATYPSGVYATLPVSGTIVVNSHAFNLTDRPATNEQWIDFWFAGPGERAYPVRGVFDSGDNFVANVPPFEQREYCRTYTLPPRSRLFQLSSHTHKHGKLFRVWGPGVTDRCGIEPDRPIKAPDCRPEKGSPILTTTAYNDPPLARYDPPFALDGDESSRTLKFCALYDNGFSNPAEVKRRSTSPVPALVAAPGGPCGDADVACLAGPNKGQLCHGDDRVCDSPGANDGRCDACPLRGGVTTEDEMFILLDGAYYVVP